MAANDPKLATLQEIALPPEVAYTPQTVGWLILALLLLAGISYLLWRIRRHRLQNRYRVEALDELKDIEAGINTDDERAVALAAIPSLIKRTVLAIAPRERVAALHGPDWLAYLAHTDPGGRLSSDVGALLTTAAYGSPRALQAITKDDTTRLIGATRTWIQEHRAPV